MRSKDTHPQTLLTTLGHAPPEYGGVVNMPPHRASTILFSTLAEFDRAERGEIKRATYGRYGTASYDALASALTALEGADHTLLFSSGVAAITTGLLAFLGNGDHALIPDNVYGPVRRLAAHELKRMGIEISYYDPSVGAGIEALIRPNTRLVYVESPGSLTMEMQDIPAIAQAAHAKGCVLFADNTWATPLYCKPFELGIDVSMHSATKYIAGHSDIIMGTLSCKREHFSALSRVFRNFGATPSADDCYLALRGLRTLSSRLSAQSQTALELAKWLQKTPYVNRVLYPALSGDPGHALWQKTLTGAASLFSIIIKPCSREALASMLNGMNYFKMGFSWGGFESLIIPFAPASVRTTTEWAEEGQCLRLHVGLEHINDLKRDLEEGFIRLSQE